jgi:GNAT superfamily N-acetyltransferase
VRIIVATSTRPLTAADLDPVIAIDRANTHQGRRHFFEKRFAAAKARPADFIHLGVLDEHSLRGFAIAHILRGEFGQTDAVAVVDALGVAPASREQGLGKSLVEGLLAAARERGARSVQSQVDWQNVELLRFFNASGFKLAPRHAFERATSELPEQIEGDV